MTTPSDKKLVKLSDEESNILSRKGYTIEKYSLNSGAYADVYKGQYNGQDVAIKVIDTRKVSEDYRSKFLPRELYVMRKLKHRFIPRMDEILLIGNRIFVVMELAEGGDLLDMINANRRPLTEPVAKRYYRQVSEALDYIHNEAIAHRDIKCENILLNKQKTVAKLTDFGFARTCFNAQSGYRMLAETQCGTTGYASPELLSGQPFDAMMNDCWGMGVVLYVMLTTKMPFTVKHLRTKQLTKHYRLQQLPISDDSKDLISKLLEPEVSKRLTMPQVLNHRWLKGVKV
ncbi:testis-specific serine/threonine-protein kinase 2-like [Oppia nitens]|uniref:testis-specific serine/threonine-protein kinase 2-like n=1 Tax=Oppia nitens TaxID=1686743 RepID=UPI0023D9F6E1|nr:testis-specific serine/threonine-protein kinase 2-like [Oppia nitens]